MRSSQTVWMRSSPVVRVWQNCNHPWFDPNILQQRGEGRQMKQCWIKLKVLTNRTGRPCWCWFRSSPRWTAAPGSLSQCPPCRCPPSTTTQKTVWLSRNILLNTLFYKRGQLLKRLLAICHSFWFIVFCYMIQTWRYILHYMVAWMIWTGSGWNLDCNRFAVCF